MEFVSGGGVDQRWDQMNMIGTCIDYLHVSTNFKKYLYYLQNVNNIWNESEV